MVWQNFLMNEDIYIFLIIILSFRALYISCRNRRMPAGAVRFLMTIWNCRIFYGYFKWISKKSDEEAAVARKSCPYGKKITTICLTVRLLFWFFFLISSGRKSRIYFRMKFISMRKKNSLWIEMHTTHTNAFNLSFSHSVMWAGFCTVSNLEHLTSAPFRFNCIHCTDTVSVRCLGIAFKNI